MAIGDFLDIKPPAIAGLQLDLRALDQRLAVVEAAAAPTRREGFHFVSADPAASMGSEGDAALHTVTGYIWRKLDGAWLNTGFSVWSDG